MTMLPDQKQPASIGAFTAPLAIFAPVMEYMIDAAQRSVLFWDVMRQRGNQYRQHLAETAPHVLDYEVELLLDGRTFDRPVNYALVRIIPPPGVELDSTRRPFVIVDPRAGHGPGIGGFKADSEIGVAFKAGHPCYFVGFLPDPVPGQTICDTQIGRHPAPLRSDMAPGLAASKRTAKSASHSRPAIRVTSWVFFRTPSPARPLATSLAQKRSSSKRSRPNTRRRTASRAGSETARRAGRS